DLLGATLTGLALDVQGLTIAIDNVAQITVSGRLAIATLTPALVTDLRSWFALKMGDVSVQVTLDPSIDLGLTADLTIAALDYNSATNAGVAMKRLDWAHAFDLDGDGQFDDALNPGAQLPVAQDLTVDLGSSLQLRLSGTLAGNGAGGALLTIPGVLTVSGSAGFALTLSTVDADTDGNGTADLLGATLTGLALDVQGLTIAIDNVAQITVSGRLAIATLTPALVTDLRSWFALKMGDVSVQVTLDPSIDLGLTADLTIAALDYNSATNAGVAMKRLDWAHAFDLDGDGQFDDALNPGAQLPVAQDLTVDLGSSLQLRLSGTLAGNGAGGALLTIPGVLTVSGSAGFALTLSTVDADTDGNGTADLLGATLTGLALDVQGLTIAIDNVAQITVSGRLAIATLTPALVTDLRSWFALKMGDVSVQVTLDPSIDLGLTADLTIAALDYNSATNAGVAMKRLDWAHAFDLDGDGQFDDALNPGAQLPVAQDLTVDLGSSLQLRLSGTLAGNGAGGALLTIPGVLTVSGSAGFALTLSTVDADTDGNGTADLLGATLTGLALDVQGLTIAIDNVAQITVSGRLAIATLTPALVTDLRSWFALKMGDVSVQVTLDPSIDLGLTADLTIAAL